MKSKELIKLLLENDPSGEMQVILGADTGEGYIPLDKVFTDPINKQQCDGDEIPYSPEVAIFLGDSNSNKAPLPKYRMELCESSKNRYQDEYEDPKIYVEYSNIALTFEESLGITTNIPFEYNVKIWLDYNQQSLKINYISVKEYFPPLFNIYEFNKKFLEYLHSLDVIESKDSYGKEAKIIKL